MKDNKVTTNDTTQKSFSIKSILIVLSTFIVLGVLIWAEMFFSKR
jgi:uncharacterized membrane protein YvbJ